MPPSPRRNASPSPTLSDSTLTTVPAKRFAVTALDKQRQEVERLMKKPDQHVNIDKKVRTLRDELTPTRDIVTNIQGSSAGAGSGDFHVYRAHRRRELLRQRIMDEDLAAEQAETEHRAKMDAIKAAEEERTAKRRAKRQKRKKSSGSKGASKKDDRDGSSDEDEDEADAERPSSPKKLRTDEPEPEASSA
ncbi:hypothetical protein BCR44DRAFT_57019 [Catenaria anguillulae PL171]|uniref:Uncharacterized protein n=1 Tax=Catenaria anguillulae PL171 TaxID=765915 RepID=A0A1Y2I082_9FUNG|nr:hypothetical protein BCR44DRAFT_57019 [Catenaria anguillulae PL171]